MSESESPDYPYVAGEKGLPGFANRVHEELAGMDATTAARVTDTGTATGAALAGTYGAAWDGRRSMVPTPGLGDAPRFTRVAGPILTAASVPAIGSIYFPSVLRVDGAIGSPLGTYYMWVSSDHGTGKIGLLYADNPVGPWTFHGVVYQDVVGTQTETPSVLYNEATGLFQMLYQQQGTIPGKVAGQVTLLATSPDGITWTRIGIAIDFAATGVLPGELHTGYQRQHRIGDAWVSLGLAGGGDYAKHGVWFSNDGITWRWDSLPVWDGADLASAVGRVVYPTELFMWRGERWAIGLDTDPVSGGTAKDAFITVGKITDDLHQYAVKPLPALPASEAQGWESVDVRSTHIFSDGAALYLYYQCGTSIGVAVAEGI